jgi:hypothetical protein
MGQNAHAQQKKKSSIKQKQRELPECRRLITGSHMVEGGGDAFSSMSMVAKV